MENTPSEKRLHVPRTHLDRRTLPYWLHHVKERPAERLCERHRLPSFPVSLVLDQRCRVPWIPSTFTTFRPVIVYDACEGLAEIAKGARLMWLAIEFGEGGFQQGTMVFQGDVHPSVMLGLTAFDGGTALIKPVTGVDGAGACLKSKQSFLLVD